MAGTESLEEFYKKGHPWMPEAVQRDLGQFNALHWPDRPGTATGVVPFGRWDYHKITLMGGRYRLHFSDRTVETQPGSLLFSSPRVPYSWESLGDRSSGGYCLFTPAFLHGFGAWDRYPVFQPGANRLFVLSAAERAHAEDLLDRMITALNSDYTYKYDLIRALILELVHGAMGAQAVVITDPVESVAARRLAARFTELLERQFPLESPHQILELRTPAAFADKLAVHVNHLNRCLREVSGKTTTQLIGDRLALEARVLLQHTGWSVSEIAYSLGYTEPAHFIQFFKGRFGLPPKAFRHQGAGPG